MTSVLIVGVLLLGVLGTTPAYAQQQPRAAATEHALDELANCRAQGPRTGGGFCPTDTPTPTATPMPPSSTATPWPTWTPQPTDVPTSTPTPAPCWLVDQDLGDPDAGYIVFDDQGDPVPCPTDTPDQVDATLPDSGRVATPTSTPAPTATPRPVPQAAAAAAPDVQILVTVQPIQPTPTSLDNAPTQRSTPMTIATSLVRMAPTSTSAPTATRTPTPSRTPTPAPTPTPTPAVVLASVNEPYQSSTPIDWRPLGVLLGLAALLLAAVGAGVALKRRLVVRRPRPPRQESY